VAGDRYRLCFLSVVVLWQNIVAFPRRASFCKTRDIGSRRPMIRVHRISVQPDHHWLERAQMLAHRVWSQRAGGVRATFRPFWGEAKPWLVELFHDKCAFCESPLLASGFGN